MSEAIVYSGEMTTQGEPLVIDIDEGEQTLESLRDVLKGLGENIANKWGEVEKVHRELIGSVEQDKISRTDRTDRANLVTYIQYGRLQAELFALLEKFGFENYGIMLAESPTTISVSRSVLSRIERLTTPKNGESSATRTEIDEIDGVIYKISLKAGALKDMTDRGDYSLEHFEAMLAKADENFEAMLAQANSDD